VVRLDGIGLEMTTLETERVGAAPIVEKWWKLGLGGWTCKENTCRLCSIESRSITRGGGRSRETIRKTIKKDLEIN
jgi:hypothetical protein